MHLTLVLDDVPFEVWLRRSGDTIAVEVDGAEFRFRGRIEGQDAVVQPIPEGGEGAAVRVAAPGLGTLLLDGDGARVRVARFEPGGGPGAYAMGQGPGGAVRTPMPGKVVAVHAAQGQAVARGEVVLVLEAMKMQVKVPSPCEGTVAKVLVKAGDTVEAAAVLFQVTAAPAPSG